MLSKWRRYLVPVLLVGCLLLVGFWEAAAYRSHRPLQPFELTAEDLAGFHPQSGTWDFAIIPGEIYDPTAPNLFSYLTRSKQGRQYIVRLVHGYNMPMCLTIKGYVPTLLQDNATRRGDQVWRLTSGAGDVSIWVTAMIRAGDFSRTDVDIRNMAFPRIAVRDDPSWVPRGVTLAGLKHPIDNLRLVLRARWNNARCNLATFLRLKQPAWADNSLLSLVAYSVGSSVKTDEESAAIQEVTDARDAVYRSLLQWQTTREEKSRSP